MYKTSDVLLNQKYFVYTLYSLRDKNLYTGFTKNLYKRLREHFSGRSLSTRFRRPFILVHYEVFINLNDARKREVFLKSGFGRKQLKSSLKETFLKVSSLKETKLKDK